MAAARIRSLVIPKPRDGETAQISLVSMIHPRTRAPVRFLKSSQQPNLIYELTSFTGIHHGHRTGGPIRPMELAAEKARSLFISNVKCTSSSDFIGEGEGRLTLPKEDTKNPNEDKASFVVSDGSLTVSTPVSPLYFIISILYKNKAQFLLPSHLHDLLEAESTEIDPQARTLDYELFKSTAYKICDTLSEAPPTENTNTLSESDVYRLSTEKLFALFDSIVERITGAGLPTDIYKQIVLAPLLPPNSVDDDDKNGVNQDLLELAKKRTAMKLLFSYVPDEISAAYYGTKESQFENLDKHLSELKKQRDAAIQRQMALSHAGGSDESQSQPFAPSKATPKRKRDTSSLPNSTTKKKTPATKSKSASGKAAGVKTLTSFFKSAK